MDAALGPHLALVVSRQVGGSQQGVDSGARHPGECRRRKDGYVPPRLAQAALLEPPVPQPSFQSLPLPQQAHAASSVSQPIEPSETDGGILCRSQQQITAAVPQRGRALQVCLGISVKYDILSSITSFYSFF